MTDFENQYNPELRDSIEAKVGQQVARIEALAVEIGGEGATVESVFPEPPEVRDDAPEPDWGDEQIAVAREMAHEFGFGTEQNVPTGLKGGALILEGGLAWKIAAELAAVADEDDPAAVIFAGSPNRKLNDAEKAFLREKYDTDLGEGATEYGLASFMADMYATAREERDLGVGYEVAEGNETIQGETGQLLRVGRRGSRTDIVLVRVDRENFTNDDCQARYRFQPDSAMLMKLTADALAAHGDTDTPVGLISSNAYASRKVDALRAGLRNGREFAVGMYGRQTMADIKGEDIKPDTPLNQLPGDLFMMHFKLQALKADLQA